MRVDNNTSNNVEYEQNGSGGGEPEAVEQSQSGQLGADGGSAEFAPVGTPPWTVTFTNLDKPSQQVSSPKTTDAGATVTLNDNWTVTVTP